MGGRGGLSRGGAGARVACSPLRAAAPPPGPPPPPARSRARRRPGAGPPSSPRPRSPPPAPAPPAAASGGGLILFFATGQATMQLGADEHNRGRVMGVWLTVLAGAQPAGNLVFGYLADEWGVTSVLLIAAAGITATAVAVSSLALAG